ncbi:MAG: hypothetical protein QNJ97_18920 [Myxococcota bacterium]|nr:hypothetical protein [Myxococcota bacterium]
MSGEVRLWYRVGGKMAMTIDQRCGRDIFRKVIRAGKDTFFQLYEALINNTHQNCSFDM